MPESSFSSRHPKQQDGVSKEVGGPGGIRLAGIVQGPVNVLTKGLGAPEAARRESRGEFSPWGLWKGGIHGTVVISKPDGLRPHPHPAWMAGVSFPLRTASTQSGRVLYTVLEDRAPEGRCGPEQCPLWREGIVREGGHAGLRMQTWGHKRGAGPKGHCSSAGRRVLPQSCRGSGGTCQGRSRGPGGPSVP